MSALLAMLVGAVTGVLSGMGVGGGTLLMLVLVELLRTEQRAAQSINLLYFLPVAASSLIGHIRSGRICLRAFLLCAAAGTVAAIGGSLLAGVLQTGTLRRLFGVLLLAAGVTQMWKRQGNGANEQKNL